MGAAGFNKKFGAVKTFGSAQGFKFGKGKEEEYLHLNLTTLPNSI